MAKANPFQFFQEVRAEMAKVTWPNRRETLVTTAMVFGFVVLASLFFFIVDEILHLGVGYVLSFGG